MHCVPMPVPLYPWKSLPEKVQVQSGRYKNNNIQTFKRSEKNDTFKSSYLPFIAIHVLTVFSDPLEHTKSN